MGPDTNDIESMRVDVSQPKPPIIFLDIDGVLNSQQFFGSADFRKVKRKLTKAVKSGELERIKYYKNKISRDAVNLLNELCRDTGAVVVISSTWRLDKSVEDLQEILSACGATFKVIDKTPYTTYERGTEIAKWLRDNVSVETWGCAYYDFHRYAIIDDDSDMLLTQRNNFFQTDHHVGLTPTICYKIAQFFSSLAVK